MSANEDARNQALLFFVDHLMQKSGRRTIHDLSCQFGARGFTDAMRQAVGTTQEGLADFLSQHPTLFTLDGDSVILNGFGDTSMQTCSLVANGANGRRDYIKDAVDFFVQKLTKFGPELQIKSLLGHRSQAAPEVRLISGRHLKEFVEFLEQQSDYFVVEADRVRLKHMPEPDERGEELDDEGKPLAGAKAKLAAVEYLKSLLEQNEDTPVPLDTFYTRFCGRFSHHVRQDVATNPKELLQFLKLNRHIFFIRSNKVSLVKNRPEGGSVDDPNWEAGSGGGSSDDSSVNNGGNSSGSGHNGNHNNNTLLPLDSSSLERITLARSLPAAQEAIQLICDELAESDRRVVGLDFKLVSVGCEQFLSLGVVSTGNRAAVLDLASSDVLLLESGLRQLLEDGSITKVIHDASRVSGLLANRHGIMLQSVFDTQVAHAVLQHDKFGKPLHEVRPIPFVNLQRVYYPQSLMLSDAAAPRKMSTTPYWGTRPITDDTLLVIVEEAHVLVCALHQHMSALMPVHVRGLFEDRCLETLLSSPTRPPAPPLMSTASAYRWSANGNASPRIQRNAAASFNSSAATTPSPRHRLFNQQSLPQKAVTTAEASTQTFSTGDIQALHFWYP